MLAVSASSSCVSYYHFQAFFWLLQAMRCTNIYHTVNKSWTQNLQAFSQEWTVRTKWGWSFSCSLGALEGLCSASVIFHYPGGTAGKTAGRKPSVSHPTDAGKRHRPGEHVALCDQTDTTTDLDGITADSGRLWAQPAAPTWLRCLSQAAFFVRRLGDANFLERQSFYLLSLKLLIQFKCNSLFRVCCF